MSEYTQEQVEEALLWASDEVDAWPTAQPGKYAAILASTVRSQCEEIERLKKELFEARRDKDYLEHGDGRSL